MSNTQCTGTLIISEITRLSKIAPVVDDYKADPAHGYKADRKVGTVNPLLQPPGDMILQHLSYTHFDQLVDIDDETKRLFYEVECIRSNWSVRELKRQIGSLYYERSGLSLNKK